ncbi:SPOR domain-containing protein [Vibrio mediterranei]
MRNFLLIFSLLLFGCSTVSTASNLEKKTITQLSVSNNYQGLIAFYKKKVIVDKENWSAQQHLAEAYLDNGDLESAQFYIDRVLTLSQTPSATAHFIKGKVLAQQLDFKQALSQYQLAIKQGLDNCKLYVQQGIAMAQTQQYPLAIHSFNQARLRGCNDVTVKNNIAIVKMYQEKYKQAIDILLPLYEQDKSNELVYANLKLSAKKLKIQQSLPLTSKTPLNIKNSTNNRKTSLLLTNTIKYSKLDDKTTQLSSQNKKIENHRSLGKAHNTSKNLTQNVKKKTHKQHYYLQLGAYDNLPDALKNHDKLSDTQLPIRIQSVNLGKSGTWFRLLSGNFSTYKQAKNYIGKHQKVLQGHSYFIQVTQ